MTQSFADVTAERFALLLGLSLFFGFAFEDFYSDELPQRPGGVRTFPLLALAGGTLYLLDPHFGAAFIAGLIVVGSWIYVFVRRQTKSDSPTVEGAFIVPVCNLLAYVLGALARQLTVDAGMQVVLFYRPTQRRHLTLLSSALWRRRSPFTSPFI